jgi:hypothetical protein
MRSKEIVAKKHGPARLPPGSSCLYIIAVTWKEGGSHV